MSRLTKYLPLYLMGWLALPATPAQAQVITILHSFTGGTGDGVGPDGSLTLSGSTFYGMTRGGGSYGAGTIFQIATDGTGYGIIYSFAGSPNDGSAPSGALFQSGTTLYGMAQYGGHVSGNNNGNGTVFKIGVDGTPYGVLHYFAGGSADGSLPGGTLAQSGTALYGLTTSGGMGGNSGYGTFFTIGPNGTGYSVLHDFAGGPGDGRQPVGTPVASGTAVYGMTAAGGTADYGTVFKIGTDGSGLTVLHAFAGGPGDGQFPNGSLLLSGATLCGMTFNGGSYANQFGYGTIFRVGIDGTGFTVLHTFSDAGDGGYPSGSLTLSGSNLYGMTSLGGTAGDGTIFQIGTDGTGFTVLHSFLGGPNDGAEPFGDLTFAGSSLYGMTELGGASNDGVVFSIPVPEPPALLLAAAAAVAIVIAYRRMGYGPSRAPGGRRPAGCRLGLLVLEGRSVPSGTWTQFGNPLPGSAG